MKKFIIIIFLIVLICLGIYFLQKNFSFSPIPSSNYTVEKTSSTQQNTSGKEENSNNQTQTETISKFSTKLPKDTKSRYSNIELACKSLNDVIVKSGETFSLWNTLGCPTKEKGYRKAKAFTSNGKVKQSYGGGICQVSTTIYNAILKVDEIKLIERHEHSKDVVYIKDGKDAAVSYKSADLKFKNNLDYDIKIKAEVKNNKVVIKIEKV